MANVNRGPKDKPVKFEDVYRVFDFWREPETQDQIATRNKAIALAMFGLQQPQPPQV